MSRDDYISKLFIKNQDKLNQEPSEDLWSKLEAQLDAPTSSVQAKPVKIVSMRKFLAAASIVLAVVTTVVIYDNINQTTDEEFAMDFVLEEPIALLTEESEPYEDADVLPVSFAEEIEEKEVLKQEEKIVAAVNKQIEATAVENKPSERVELSDINIRDENANTKGNSIIFIEPEDEEESFDIVQKEYDGDLYQGDLPVVQQQMNYASGVPQIANNDDNNFYADKVLRKSESSNKDLLETTTSNEDELAQVQQNRIDSRMGIVQNIKKRKSNTKSPMEGAHVRLQPFGFLLGQWVDENEKEGQSYETWTLKNPKTIIGKGYILSKENESIFEETMRIELKYGQVFFVMSLDENKSKIEYMLSKYNSERFTFVQSSSDIYPNKITIQRTLEGFSTVIVNTNSFLTNDQQRYLENRNRVTNVGSKRTMNYK
ncbi:MAG: hypothetical protein MK207_00355 [Saprospiraceae bacterium]|nr:hypothetical protein [Saprospiraceae bacterium]